MFVLRLLAGLLQRGTLAGDLPGTLKLLGMCLQEAVPWAAPLTAIPFIAFALLSLWAFRTSLGGQKIFAMDALDE